MRKLPLLMLVVVVVAMMFSGVANAGRLQKRNRVDHYKHYKTCATCPRGPMATVVDYGPDGKRNHRYWAAQSVNGNFWGNEPLYYVWESGSIYYKNGRCTSTVQWNAGAHVYEHWWNKWKEDPSKRTHVDGSGPYSPGHPAYRYRRTIFHFEITQAGWNIADRTKWVGMTLRCNGTWHPSG